MEGENFSNFHITLEWGGVYMIGKNCFMISLAPIVTQNFGHTHLTKQLSGNKSKAEKPLTLPTDSPLHDCLDVPGTVKYLCTKCKLYLGVQPTHIKYWCTQCTIYCT